MRSIGMAVLVALLAASSRDAAAQSRVCETIRPGDTASAVARRLTGRADSRYRPWFQIVDAGWRPVAKSRYGRINAGWRACVPPARAIRPLSVARRAPSVRPDPPGEEAASAAAPVLVPPAAVSSAPPPVVPSRPPEPAGRARDIVYICFAAAAFGAAIGLAWQALEQFLAGRRAVVREMQVFGEVFVRDFERPLLAAGTERPIRARVRCAPAYRRLDILLAPADGRRYPNLDDHRHNVEYDVERITERLRHHPFVRKPLRTEGRWVVIPFKFDPGPKTGAAV